MFKFLPSTYLSASTSDKISVCNYGSLYDMFFATVLFLNENRPIKVCEIGVSLYGTGSMHKVSQMPDIEKYVGIDKIDPFFPIPEKCVFIQGDAYAEETLHSAYAQGPYHLIIDDGDHTPESQFLFFKHYRGLCAVPSLMEGDINGNQASIWIGKKANESVWLDGTLDELRILNIALTEEQIQEDMEGISFAVEVTGKLTTTWGRIKTDVLR